MKESPDTQTCHVDAALEASCEALVTLELLESSADGNQRLRDQVRLAIEQLRRAVAELREAREQPATVLAYGFILDEHSARVRACH